PGKPGDTLQEAEILSTVIKIYAIIVASCEENLAIFRYKTSLQYSKRVLPAVLLNQCGPP
ncbi:MAG TPA: hypothetical protein VFN35_06235, partial [Ktedonobacteraceae bacterium]|nr:hypothetical protein [Ktedonobacteraceae bacterium]